MSAPYYTDTGVTLWHGDALDVLAELPSGSVDCCVTSPPYYRLRDYGEPGQLGQESTPGEYVAGLVAVFAQVRRMLRPDGTCWVNLGDTYNALSSGQNGTGSSTLAGGRAAPMGGRRSGRPDPGLPGKSLLGMPWRVASALQGDGWLLRNAIVWHKPNALPDPASDRAGCRYELLFLLALGSRYWFDRRALDRDPRCAGDVWTLPTRPGRSGHPAGFPVDVPLLALGAGCRPGGVVLDPFCGTATTGAAARLLGRSFLGVDLHAPYLDAAVRTRFAAPTLPSVGEVVA